jgi:hypothetical protein
MREINYLLVPFAGIDITLINCGEIPLLLFPQALI